MAHIFLWLMLLCPVTALVFNCLLTYQPVLAARLSGYCIGLGFLLGVGLLSCLSLSQHPTVYLLISLNTLSLLLCSLVLLVSFIVHRFSLKKIGRRKPVKKNELAVILNKAKALNYR